MFCSSCGQENAATVSFCEFCGLDLRNAVPSAVGAPAGGPVPPSASEATAAVTQLGRSIVAALTLGEKLTVCGAVAATIGFFMPFVSSPDLASLSSLLANISPSLASATHLSYSLFDFSKLLGAIYFVLIAAVASDVLFYFSRKANRPRKLLISGFQVLIGSTFGPHFIFFLLFIPLIQSVAGIGYWLIAIGFCSIAAGGLITTYEMAR